MAQFLVLAFMQSCKRCNLTSISILLVLNSSSLSHTGCLHGPHDAFFAVDKQIQQQNAFFWHHNVMLCNHHCERFIFQKLQENEWWGYKKVFGITSRGFSILLHCCSSRWCNWKIHLHSHHFKFCLGFYCSKSKTFVDSTFLLKYNWVLMNSWWNLLF